MNEENKPRKPASFKLDNSPEKNSKAEPKRQTKPADRKPKAMDANIVEFTPESEGASFADHGDAQVPIMAPRKRRTFSAGTIFIGALSLLISLSIGLWAEALIIELFAQTPWLGYVAMGLAGLAGLALIWIIMRELRGLFNLASREKLRNEIQSAYASDDMPRAKKAISDLQSAIKTLPETAKGRTRFDDADNTFMSAQEFIGLAETELLAELDRKARLLVRDASRRVSVVTAVSPRALVDVAYVIYECTRLIRNIASLYGTRPGTLGFWRLARRVVEHLAVTGTIALGDGLIQQFLGHGMAARVSTRLGEGVINGLMTVRIGIAAIEVTRPAPFITVPAPKASLFLSDLTK